MTERGEGQTPFDERAALEELERFRDDIERYRQRRKEIGDEFEQFIRSFKPADEVFVSSPASGAVPPASAPAVHSPRAAPVSPAVGPVGPAAAPAAPPPPAARTVPPSVRVPGDGAADAVRRPQASVAHPSATPPSSSVRPVATSVPPVAPVTAAPERRSGRNRLWVAGLLALLVIAAVATWNSMPRAPGSSSTPSTGAAPAAPPGAIETPTPSAGAPAPAPSGSELTTIRPVWLRVMVDGERVIERELPAGARVSLNPQQTIVIRTGDAGAVRLSIAGQDQGPLGRDGEVVTKSFTVPGSR